MLFGLPISLALLLLGKTTPQTNAEPGGNAGPGGTANQSVPGGNAGAAPGGGTPGSPQIPVDAPPGFIQPQEIYTLDPNNPDNRFTGVQMREAVIRAGQYDNLQSEFHRQQGELTTEREARQTAEQQLQEIREQENLTKYMQQMGYGPQQPAQPSSPQGQAPNQSAPPAQQQPGQQPGVQGDGLGADGDFLMNYGFAPSASPGQPDGSGNPASQPGSDQAGLQNPGTQANSPQSLLNDPRQLALMMRAIIQDELSKTSTPLQQIPTLVGAAVDQRFNQQARQDGVRQSFQAGRQQLANDLLQKWGIEDSRSRDILDKWALSSASYEEASRLMQGQYADDNQRAQAQQVADEKIGQGNMFFNAALQDAVTAAQEGQATRMQTEAQNALLSGDYVNMGEMEQPQMNVWDPEQIAQITRANLQKGMEIAETQGRLQAVAGPIGGPQQPNGFLQPQFIQPGQPGGYGAPLTPTQPMWTPPQGGQVPPQPQQYTPQRPAPAPQQGQPNVQQGQPNMPAWGAYQQQGYGQRAA